MAFDVLCGQVVGHKSADEAQAAASWQPRSSMMVTASHSLGQALVVAIPAGSKAEEAGLMPGDRLEVPMEWGTGPWDPADLVG